MIFLSLKSNPSWAINTHTSLSLVKTLTSSTYFYHDKALFQKVVHQLGFLFTDSITNITGKNREIVLEPLLTSLVSVSNDRGAMSDSEPAGMRVQGDILRHLCLLDKPAVFT